MKTKVTNAEILKAITGINNRLDHSDQRFDNVDKRFDGVEERLNKNEVTLDEIVEAINVFSEAADLRFDNFELKTDQQFAYMKSVMVTKDYLDDKLSDLRGDLVATSRNGNTKLTTLVEILSDRKAITINDKKKILSMEPFGRI